MTHATKQNEAGNKSGRESLGGIYQQLLTQKRIETNKHSKSAVHDLP